MSSARLRSRSGFTLVELLVVIGIIALLISILLPSLARARQAATLVSCQSRFKQIYNGLLFYAQVNKDYLPVCADDDRNASAVNPDIYVALTPLLGGSKTLDKDSTGPFSPAFACTEQRPDTGVCWAPNAICTMKWNPRAFPGEGYAGLPQRKLASIKASSEKIAFWEGQQILIWNMSTEPSAVHLDNWGISYGHQFTDPPADGSYARWDSTIVSGPNADVMNWWITEIRFRHLGNTTTPVAFFDGHVESRKVGEIKVKDMCISK